MYSDRAPRERKPNPRFQDQDFLPVPPSPPTMATPGNDGLRKRKANFSTEEKFMLVNGYKKYKDLLGRDSDASLERRAKLWQDITDRFNDEVSLRDGFRAVQRTTPEVRKKWRAMCTQARKNKEDYADNPVPQPPENCNGWIDKQYELDNEIITLLGEMEGDQSDDAWSEMDPDVPDSPVETKWSATMQQQSKASHTLPVQAPKRSRYNNVTPPIHGQPGNVTPIILHTESLMNNILEVNPATAPLAFVDECDFIRKKRGLELEKMQLENSILRMQLTKVALEVQALKAGIKSKEDDRQTTDKAAGELDCTQDSASST